jgi:uncharacterized protein YlxW (UPF0749 family)
MSPGSHARGEEAERPRAAAPRRWLRWRIGTPAVFLLCGSLFVVSATNSEGTDLRPGRYTDLASLVESEAEQYDALEQRVKDLNADVAELASAIEDGAVKRVQRRVEELRDPAGLTPRTGPGLTITLSDAPEDVINSSERNVNLLVVHQRTSRRWSTPCGRAAPAR